MGGLGNLFKKIIPIIMLVCFICLGITHTFQQAGLNNITYMSKTYYDRETYQIIENPTEQQKVTAIQYYNLDVNNYMQGIAGNNTLERAVSKTIDLQTYQNTLNTFNAIWEDGYQFGDGIQTLVNAIILTINTILLPINIVLVPVRIITALILTGLSVLGIKTAGNTGIIITALNGIVDHLNIPLIDTTENANNTALTYVFNNSITISQNFENLIEFSTIDGQYKAIKVWENNGTSNIAYVDLDNNQVTVYSNGWIYEVAKTITFATQYALEDGNAYVTLRQFLNNNATLTI